jgi:hypothetical protein
MKKSLLLFTLIGAGSICATESKKPANPQQQQKVPLKSGNIKQDHETKGKEKKQNRSSSKSPEKSNQKVGLIHKAIQKIASNKIKHTEKTLQQEKFEQALLPSEQKEKQGSSHSLEIFSEKKEKQGSSHSLEIFSEKKEKQGSSHSLEMLSEKKEKQGSSHSLEMLSEKKQKQGSSYSLETPSGKKGSKNSNLGQEPQIMVGKPSDQSSEKEIPVSGSKKRSCFIF